MSAKFLIVYSSPTEKRTLMESECITEAAATDIFQQSRSEAADGRLVLYRNGVAIRIHQGSSSSPRFF